MKSNDNVFRALHPKRAFERPNGSISPAAFKDRQGLSVEIGLNRSDHAVVSAMHLYLEGNILKISIAICEDNKVEIFDDKRSSNEFHRLLLNKDRVDGDFV